MLQHTNIVRCLGHCYEIQKDCLPYDGKYVFAEMAEMLLCLEYMSKGSLDKHISDESSGLDWSTRYNIIEGICYGLCHLHEEIDKPIIHLDLKPANILLDDGMTAKIADFGLSRLLYQEQTICTKSRDGTFGYMAPEFILGGKITPKSDIFSLGVIILEVVTGHRDYPDVTITPSDDFIKLMLKKWRNVLQRSPRYLFLETVCEQIRRCIQVGMICVHPDRTKRPSIKKAISMLQGSESIEYSRKKAM
uniref:Protein kinase domain-containing protein n=1 Tax=Triticum urartu TaxID=4572 RepID=A0A8R7R9A2_TRIUA